MSQRPALPEPKRCEKCGHELVFIRDRNFPDGSGKVWMCENAQCELWQLYVYPERPKRKRQVKAQFPVWKLKDKATRESIPMSELKDIIESERHAQIDWNNGINPEVEQALNAMDSVWRIANGYECKYDG